MNDGCAHINVERTRLDPPAWLCSNPSCRLEFRSSDALAEAAAERMTDTLDQVAGVMSAVLWDQGQRMTEWLIGHGATVEEATEEAKTANAFFLDAEQHQGEKA